MGSTTMMNLLSLKYARAALGLLLVLVLPVAVTAFAPTSTSAVKPVKRRSSTAIQTPPTALYERKPWDIVRFVQQSSKFVTLPFLGGSKERAEARMVQPGDVLWQPASSSSKRPPSFTMAPLDDVVMGGASSSSFNTATGIWTGTVTDANNGGFIGIRSTPLFKWNCGSSGGLEYQLKSPADSDRRFKLVVRDSTDFNGITWSHSVTVTPGISKVRVAWNEFVPTQYARTIDNSPPLETSNIVGVQIAYSKFEYNGGLNPSFFLGDVHLQILQLSAY